MWPSTDGAAVLPARSASRRATTRRRSRPSAADAAPAKAEPPAWRVRGSFALDHQRIALDEFRFETGPPTSLHRRRHGLCRARRRSALRGDGDRRAGALRRGDGARQDRGRPDAAGPRRRYPRRAARPAAAVDPRLDRRRPAGGRGRRHHHPRRQAAGRAGRGRLADEDAVGFAARPHDAGRRRAC